jgi:hypothetical protein
MFSSYTFINYGKLAELLKNPVSSKVGILEHGFDGMYTFILFILGMVGLITCRLDKLSQASLFYFDFTYLLSAQIT